MTKMARRDPSLQQKVRQYQIVGRAAPSKKVPEPKTYRMKLFARNRVLAESKFWFFMRKLQKAKRSGGEILAVNEIFERHPQSVKNFGIWLRYDSRTGTHNMYKEYRDLTQCGAVSQMMAEMSGRHRALSSNVQVLRIEEVKSKDCRRPHVTQLHKSRLAFPLPRHIPLIPKELRMRYAARPPTVFQK